MSQWPSRRRGTLTNWQTGDRGASRCANAGWSRCEPYTDQQSSMSWTALGKQRAPAIDRTTRPARRFRPCQSTDSTRVGTYAASLRHALLDCLLRSRRCSLVAAVFVGFGGTESVVPPSPYRSAARTSGTRFLRRPSPEEGRLVSLLVECSRRSLTLTLLCCCLPHSLAARRAAPARLPRLGRRRRTSFPGQTARLARASHSARWS